MKTVWTGRAISGLACLPFAMASTMKFAAPNPKMLEAISQMGIPLSLIRPIGVLEIMCVVVYLIPQTSVLGAILFTGFIGGSRDFASFFPCGEVPSNRSKDCLP